MTPVALQRDLAANDGACLDRTVVAAPVLGDLLLVCPDDQIMAQRGKPEMGHAVGVDITGQPRGLYGIAQHLPEDCLAPIMAGTFGSHRHDHAIPRSNRPIAALPMPGIPRGSFARPARR